MLASLYKVIHSKGKKKEMLPSIFMDLKGSVVSGPGSLALCRVNIVIFSTASLQLDEGISM